MVRRIEEAVSLVNQMPEDVRLDAWQFWQKVSTAVKAATTKMRRKSRSVPGGKDIVPKRRRAAFKKEEILEKAKVNDDQVTETVVVEYPVSSTLSADGTPVFTSDQFSHDLKLLYNTVSSSCETSDAVAAMLAIQDQATTGTPGDNKQPSQSAVQPCINVLVQDIVNDEVITSLVSIEDPRSSLGNTVISLQETSSNEKLQNKTQMNTGPNSALSSSDEERTSEQQCHEIVNQSECKIDNAAEEGTDLDRVKTVENVLLQEFRSDTSVENVNVDDDVATAEPRVENASQPKETDSDSGEVSPVKESSEDRPRRSNRQRKPKHSDGVEDGEAEEPMSRKRRVRGPDQPKAELGPIKCEVCGDILAYSSSLAAHMRKHTGDRPFVCSLCPKMFTTKANMLRHERTHSGEKPFECEICHKCFTEKKTLKVHMRQHTGEKPFKCPYCEKSFSQSGTLKTHMTRHTGQKANLCDLCGQAFRQKSQLRIHIRRHMNIKSIACPKCDQMFFSKGDLGRHLMKHSGERPYICNLCPKTFTRLQYLKEHINLHNGVTPYTCSTCSDRFSDHSSYYRHLQKHKKAKDGAEKSQIHFVLDGKTGEGENVDNVPALIVTGDHIQQILGVNSVSPGEVYQIALVDQTNPGDTIDQGTQVDQGEPVILETSQDSQEATQVDFSAMNLLANATTQFITMV